MYCKCGFFPEPHRYFQPIFFDCGHLLHYQCFISSHYFPTYFITEGLVWFEKVTVYYISDELAPFFKCLVCGYIQVMELALNCFEFSSNNSVIVETYNHFFAFFASNFFPFSLSSVTMARKILQYRENKHMMYWFFKIFQSIYLTISISLNY